MLVFAQAYGGDVGELVVFMDEGGVGVGGVAAAGEDVEYGNRVARGEPVGDGDREREGCIVAVRGENKDLQVAAPGGTPLFYGEVVSGLRPVGDKRVDDDVAYAVGVVESGEIGAVLANLGLREAFGCGDANALLIVVGGGAEDEYAVDVELVGIGEPGEGLHGAGVFHAADGVGAATVGLVFDPVACPLVEDFAVPEGCGGEIVATEDEGWTVRGFAFVLHAALFDLRSVREFGVFGEVERPVYQRGIEVVDIPVVPEAGSTGLLIGG